MTTSKPTDIIPLAKARTLAGAFLERVRRTPDATASIQYHRDSQEWHQMTWKTMSLHVARWRAALMQEELKPGERVCLMLKNCREWAFFDLAAQSLGLVTVPVYTNDRAENIGYMLQDAGVRLFLLENDEQWQQLQQIRNQLAGLERIVTLEPVKAHGMPRLVTLDAWLPQEYPQELKVDELDPDALATIVYTSGTTGRPKGVMLSHTNILWDLQQGLKMIPVYPDDRLLSFLPLSHTLERTVGYYMPIVAGASIAYARSIPELAEDLLAIKPTMIIAVPRIFERVYGKIQEKLAREPIPRQLFNLAVESGWADFEHRQGHASWSPLQLLWPLLDKLVASKIRARFGGRLRIAVSGGAPLREDIARVFIGLGVPILQGYGLTETSPIISANSLDDNLPASVGKALAEIEVNIGEHEELLVRSPSVMLGYWNNPQATREVIDKEGWLHTGDKVRVEDGHIFITGRIKEILVLTNGEKVPPADMEMCICMDSLFEQSLVIGEARPYLTALIVLNPEISKQMGIDPEQVDEPQERMLINRISEHLESFPGYVKINRIAILKEPWTVDNGLMTPTMKIRRERIQAHYAELIDSLYQGHYSNHTRNTE